MIIALNNKCNLTKEEFNKYQEELEKLKYNCIMILCASPLNIGKFKLTKCHLGAQNVSKDSVGAHTGEISATQLKSYNVEYCIIGHSERRQDQKETNDDISKKIRNLYDCKIIPILCVGESKEQKDAGKVKEVITEEIISATKDLTEDEKNNLIVAYEPIWSIGTGIIPTTDEIANVLKLIRELLPNAKLLYGGSANEKNIEELKVCSYIEGYLLGGLSLKPEQLNNFIEKLEN